MPHQRHIVNGREAVKGALLTTGKARSTRYELA
jgi:hypothetical protein